MSKKDLYAILGVAKNATQEEIEKAYKKLARAKHPDKGGSNSEFVDIQKAYSTLKDPKSRKMYDSGFDADNPSGFGQGGGYGGFSQQDFNSSGFGDFEDIFASFFGGGNSRSRGSSSSSVKGQDIEFKTQMSLKDAFYGINVNINYYKMAKCNGCNGVGADKSRMSTCSSCRGSGVIDIFIFGLRQQCSACSGKGKIMAKCDDCSGNRMVKTKVSKSISIPAGVEHGQKLIFKTLGNEGLDAPNGNLIVLIDIQKDAVFERNGTTLMINKEVNISTMVFGGKIKVETIDGKSNEADVKMHSKVGDRVIIRGAGMPKYNSSSRGDMYITLVPSIPNPTNMTNEERQAWEVIYKSQNSTTPPQQKKGFFF